MTWAQGTFGFCFGIMAPAVGVMSAMRLKRDGKSRFKGFILGSMAMFIALLVCCLVAQICYPKYPRQRIPELIANAFTVPAVVAGMATIWFVSKTPARRFCQVASTVLIMLYVAGILLCYQFFTWGFRKALPWSARDIHEWYWQDGFLPDFSYHLKAKVTEEQFQRYIAKFNLTPHTPTRKYSDESAWLIWQPAPLFNSDWWDPSPSLDSTYVFQASDSWTFAKYERGYLYLASLDH